jgi:hypothetical protein
MRRPSSAPVVCIQEGVDSPAQLSAWQKLWRRLLVDGPTNTKPHEAATSRGLSGTTGNDNHECTTR